MSALEMIVQRVALSAQVIAIKFALKEITAEERDKETEQMIRKNLGELAYFEEIKLSEAII